MKKILTSLLVCLLIICAGSANAQTISGPSSFCDGTCVTMAGSPAGGTWSVSPATTAIVSSTTGVVCGLSVGTFVLTYTLPSSAYTTMVMTVNVMPTPLTGITSINCGGTTTLSSTTIGGLFNVAPITVATMSPSGTLTGISTGTATVSYRIGTCATTTIVTVTPYVSAGAISGPSTACTGSTVTLSSTMPGGIWTTTTGNASVSSLGVVTGVAVGSDVISYTVTTSCGTATTTYAMTVGAIAPITGSLTVACGGTTTLSSATSGGTWVSATAPIATITGAGVATAYSPGVVMITYTATAACGTGTATAALTVTPTAYAGIISGPTAVCVSDNITLSSTTTGGAWSSLTGNSSVTSAGIATGVTAGPDTIHYIVTSACGIDTAGYPISVSAPITVSASASAASCGDTYLAAATGAISYLWSPTTGVSCVTCATTAINRLPPPPHILLQALQAAALLPLR